MRSDDDDGDRGDAPAPGGDPWAMADGYALSDDDVARRLEFLQFTEEDAARLRRHLPALEPHLPDVACALYAHAATVPHLARLLDGHVIQCRVKQAAYLKQMFTGRVDRVYAASRAWVGQVHLRFGLEPRWYLAAFSTLQELLNERIAAALADDPAEALRVTRSLGKLVLFDAILALDAYVDGLLGELRAREEVLRELSAPAVLEVLPGIHVVPVVGRLDDAAALALRGALLQALMRQARAVVLDVSRLARLDAPTGRHVFRLAEEARSLGAAVVVAGVSPVLERELTRLGVPTGAVPRRTRLADAVEEARRRARARECRQRVRRQGVAKRD